MGITVAGFDLTSENLLIVGNLVLIIIAVLLLIRLRIADKKNKTEKEKQSELAGIVDIKPEDFNMDRLDLNKEILQQEKSDVKPPGTIDVQSVTPEINGLKLEDDPPEETIVIQSEDITSGIETQPLTISVANNVKPGTIEDTEELPENPDTISIDVQSEDIASETIPEIINSNIVTNPGNAEKPNVESAKKKKPGRKKKVSASAGTQTPAKEKKPKKKASKRESLF
jgi:hypothetical protein